MLKAEIEKKIRPWAFVKTKWNEINHSLNIRIYYTNTN